MVYLRLSRHSILSFIYPSTDYCRQLYRLFAAVHWRRHCLRVPTKIRLQQMTIYWPIETPIPGWRGFLPWRPVTAGSCSTLAASLGPLMIVRALGQPITTGPARAMMATGMVTALTWRLGLGLADSICEALAGMVAGAIVYLIVRGATRSGSIWKAHWQVIASQAPELLNDCP
jgi:hypothetical protein